MARPGDQEHRAWKQTSALKVLNADAQRDRKERATAESKCTTSVKVVEPTQVLGFPADVVGKYMLFRLALPHGDWHRAGQKDDEA